MLTIQPTENLTGLSISGDYWDLDDLLHAIYEVVGMKNGTSILKESDSAY